MQSDKDLVERTLGGETQAFGDLVRRYERAVCAASMAILKDRHLMEDAAQESFLVAYERLGSLRNPSAFGAWVIRIAKRKALHLAKRQDAAPGSVEIIIEDYPDSNGQLDESSQSLLGAVMRLPKHERQVVTLHYFDDLSVKEVADITNRPIGTVTKQLQRARERLRKRMKEFEI